MSPKDLTDQFVARLIATFDKEHVLFTNPNVSGLHPHAEEVFHAPIGFKTTEFGSGLGESYDLIFGNLPLAFGKGPGEPPNWSMIAEISDHLSDDGMGFFIIEPRGFYGPRGENFLRELEESGIFVNAYFETPAGIWNQTSIAPTIAFISKQQRTFFVSEMSSEGDIIQILENIKQSDFSNVTEASIERRAFISFEASRAARQIRALTTKYKEFESRRFSEIFSTKIRGRKDHELPLSETGIYFRQIRHKQQVLLADEFEDQEKHHFFTYLEPIAEVQSTYLQSFFATDLGKLIVQSATTGFMPRIDFRVLDEIKIPVPDLETQKRILRVTHQIQKLETELSSFKGQIALNPLNTTVSARIDEMLQAASLLTESEKLKSRIAAGETKTQEFKQTLEYCLREKKKADRILRSALKTIAGFLNTQGGTLFVGVADEGGIPGINLELDKFHRSLSDNMLLHLNNKIKSDLGDAAMDYIDMEIHEVDGNLVLVVECDPSKTPVFYKKEHFFVRRPARTDELKGEAQHKYYAQRFYSSN